MNTGLVLSGGGVRGIAHIGVIKALEENNIHPNFIAGTSAGAVVGALYAGGCSWKEILNFFDKLDLFTISKYAINKPGFIDTEKFYNNFKPFLPLDDFKMLKKKLFITATNLLDGTLKVFTEGELIKPILASAAFPGVFTPIKIDNTYYIDGGTINNFPVELISMHCDQIIGVYVNPFEEVENDYFKHSYTILERALSIKSANDSFSKFDTCDLLITPKELGNYGTFHMKHATEIFDLGYKEAIETFKGENGIQFLIKYNNPTEVKYS
ncbi:patatin-like phospholipase family protein [Lutibacter sp.]|uniref:patatin-like phospholipase family protein n=1 Tax=Lutibacter sp. TaxID=1925666 RepID=UPI0035663E23